MKWPARLPPESSPGRTFLSLANVIGVALILRLFLISSYVMSGSSMRPVVEPGDFLVAWLWHGSALARGDVIVLHCPEPAPPDCLKRVAGVAGDRIEYAEGHFVLNGEVTARLAEGPPGPVVVPPGFIYVLDERARGVEDSRLWGALAQGKVEARVIGTWFSLDWQDPDGRPRAFPRVRWDRLTPFKAPL